MRSAIQDIVLGVPRSWCEGVAVERGKSRMCYIINVVQDRLSLVTRDGCCRFGKASDQGLSLKRAGPLPAIKVRDSHQCKSVV